MPEPDECAMDSEAIDYDAGEIDDRSYLRSVEATLCEWLGAADAEAYDGLWDDSDSPALTPSSRA